MRTGLLRRLSWILAIIIASGAVSCAQLSNGSASKPAEQAPVSAAAKPATPAAAAPPAIPVADISGSWKWTVDAQGAQINHSAKFKQSGQTLGGSWTDSYGDQPVTADIKEGSVKDGKVSFKVTRSSPFGDGSEMTLTFSGTLSAAKDKIDGTINVNIPGADPIPSEWHATRSKD
jgi:hypothetical protein